jgi:hypothetical protein
MARMLLQFDSPDSVADWSPVDDVVMGGCSHSSLAFHPDGYALFAGFVSLENNGGFASVRSAVRDFGAPHTLHYVFEIAGDGRRYKLNLRIDGAFDGINYQASFATTPDAWTCMRLPIAEFRPTLRGRRVIGAPALNPARVRRVGLMIGDGQAGEFALCVRTLAAE